MSEATAKAPSQRERLLELLRQRGPAGVSNLELVRTCGLRYGARIFELRRLRFEIETRRLSESTFLFVLRSEPTPEAHA